MKLSYVAGFTVANRAPHGITTTQKCRFMSKEVRENRAFFVAPPRAFPLSVRASLTRDIQIITQNSTPISTVSSTEIHLKARTWLQEACSCPCLPALPGSCLAKHNSLLAHPCIPKFTHHISGSHPACCFTPNL